MGLGHKSASAEAARDPRSPAYAGSALQVPTLFTQKHNKTRNLIRVLLALRE